MTLLDAKDSILTEFPLQTPSDLASSVLPGQLTPIKMPSIPDNSTIILDLRQLRLQNKLEEKICNLLQVLLPNWSATQVTDIKLQHISGALTNSIFTVATAHPLHQGPRKVLLRVYGVGAEKFVDREREIEWLAKLSTCDIGAKLLATFGNGRVEEFLDSVTLTHREMVQDEVAVHIAQRMSDLHNLTLKYPAPLGSVPLIWDCIEKWLPLAKEVYPSLSAKYPSVDFDQIEIKFAQLRTHLGPLDSQLVFCHNDTQYGNILRMRKSSELAVVDFEYAGYNHRAYDIGNHFCEWMANYDSPTPHRLTEAYYPSIDQQRMFAKAYLDAQFATYSESAITELLTQVTQFSLASHLKWGLWGIIQASTSEIEFDYMAYGTQRLNLFLDWFDARFQPTLTS